MQGKTGKTNRTSASYGHSVYLVLGLRQCAVCPIRFNRKHKFCGANTHVIAPRQEVRCDGHRIHGHSHIRVRQRRRQRRQRRRRIKKQFLCDSCVLEKYNFREIALTHTNHFVEQRRRRRIRLVASAPNASAAAVVVVVAHFSNKQCAW